MFLINLIENVCKHLYTGLKMADRILRKLFEKYSQVNDNNVKRTE